MQNAPDRVDTLAIDIGGTGLKASVLDAGGSMEHSRVKIDTPYPLSPQKMVAVLTDLVKDLPKYERASAGFPGMVRDGRILSAPHFVSKDGPGGKPDDALSKAWDRFDLQGELQQSLGVPTKVANDADVQGAAVIKGQGLELVLTLGTGFGTAFFKDGVLQPHLEFAHHPFHKQKSYNEVVGEAARKSMGNKKWRKHVIEAIQTMAQLCFFDHCFVGGGNATHLHQEELAHNVSITDNSAGILGGIKLWEVQG